MKSRYTKLVKIQLLLMALLVLINIIMAIVLLAIFDGSGGEAARLVNIYVAVLLLNAAGFVLGIIYVGSGYEKKAAHFYKLFLLALACSQILNVFAASADGAFGAYSVLSLLKVIVLLILALWADLGQEKTMTIFYVLLVLDLLLGFSLTSRSLSLTERIVSTLSRLLADGTIGLCIKEKYEDKARRGSN